MSAGLFLQVTPDEWAEVAVDLIGTEWPDRFAIMDVQSYVLRYRELPTVRESAERWGWSKSRAGRLLATPDRWAPPWLRKMRPKLFE